MLMRCSPKTFPDLDESEMPVYMFSVASPAGTEAQLGRGIWGVAQDIAASPKLPAPPPHCWLPKNKLHYKSYTLPYAPCDPNPKPQNRHPTHHTLHPTP